jgi:hypothetical protein
VVLLRILVQVDNRMRAWYTKNMASGLLYSCALGDVRPDCPVALINNRQQDGTEIMEVVPMEHQLPAQRQQVGFAFLSFFFSFIAFKKERKKLHLRIKALKLSTTRFGHEIG